MKIIKISSLWCPSCIIVDNILSEINDIEIEVLDAYNDIDKIKEYNPGNIMPILIFVDKNGKELDRLIGEQKKENIVNLITKYKNL